MGFTILSSTNAPLFDPNADYAVLDDTKHDDDKVVLVQLGANGAINYFQVTLDADKAIDLTSIKAIDGGSITALEVPSDFDSASTDQVQLLKEMVDSCPSLKEKLGSYAGTVSNRYYELLTDPNTSVPELQAMAADAMLNMDITTFLGIMVELSIRTNRMQQQALFAASKCSNKEIQFYRDQNKLTQEKIAEQMAKIAHMKKLMGWLQVGMALLGVIIAIVCVALAVAAVFSGGATVPAIVGLIVGFVSLIASVASLATACVTLQGGKVPEWVDWLILAISVACIIVSLGAAAVSAVSKIVTKVISEIGRESTKAIIKETLKQILHAIRRAAENMLNKALEGVKAIGKGAQKFGQGIAKIARESAEEVAQTAVKSGALNRLASMLKVTGKFVTKAGKEIIVKASDIKVMDGLSKVTDVFSRVKDVPGQQWAHNLKEMAYKLQALTGMMQGVGQITQGALSIKTGELRYDLKVEQALSDFFKSNITRLQSVVETTNKSMDEINGNYKKMCEFITSYLKNLGDTQGGIVQNIHA